jgi:hypothetical protein
MRRSTLAIALVAVGLFAVGSTAVALTTSSTIHARGTTKTTIVRYDPGTGQSTTSSAFQDIIAGTQPTITFTKPSILLVTLTAETSCFNNTPSGSASWCTARILVDGVGELGPGTGTDFAFDSANQGADLQTSWEGHAMQRSSNVLPPGTYTVRPQYAVQGPATFQIDEVHVTVEAVQA